MVQIFKALSEDNRLRMLSLFVDGRDLCVCEIEEILGMTQSNVSRHLTVLKNCGLLESYRKAQWIYYKLNETFISENRELWSYLSGKLMTCITYEADCRKLELFRSADPCGCKKEGELL